MKTSPYSLVLQSLRKFEETEQILREMLSFDNCLIFDGLSFKVAFSTASRLYLFFYQRIDEDKIKDKTCIYDFQQPCSAFI